MGTPCITKLNTLIAVFVVGVLKTLKKSCSPDFPSRGTTDFKMLPDALGLKALFSQRGSV